MNTIYYTNGVSTIRIPENQEPPIGYWRGRTFKSNPWNKGLTKESSEKVLQNTNHAQETRRNRNYTAWNKGLSKSTDSRVSINYEKSTATLRSRYGVSNPGQLPHEAWNKGLTSETDGRVAKISAKRKGSIAWNKGLTKDTDHRIHSHKVSQETKDKIRNAHLSEVTQFKRYHTMIKNKTLGLNSNTVVEQNYYAYLLNQYSENDIKRWYMDARYPFKCDFYIVSEDKFIEIHGTWTHGGQPYDPDNPECQKQLLEWQEKAKTSKYYQNAIYTWTDLDVRKRKIAEENKLNYQVIYYK